MTERRLKFWGWGTDESSPGPEEARGWLDRLAARTGLSGSLDCAPPKLTELDLRAPRLTLPAALARVGTASAYERALHSYGKSYPDYIRAFGRDYRNPPDIVAYPEGEDDIRDLLEWADGAGAAVIPFGCGSSVVGGIEPMVGDAFTGTLTIDLRRMDRVLEVDGAGRAARIQAGALGPGLEAQLRPHGLTLRHFPQSFEFSTLGGWIATRSGGHFATLYTHIDDLVESLRVVTPSGTLQSRRLPGSGAGPSPDRMFMGSEGSLGVITEAWMRLQDRPTHRAGASILFEDFRGAAEAIRALSHSGLHPANCRLVDAEEVALAGAGDGGGHMVLVGFESADHPQDGHLARALELARDYGGVPEDTTESGAARTWREAFIRAPYLREVTIANGVMHDTFETAITWDRFDDFHANVMDATRKAIREATGRKGHVTCRFTHCYPDGPAPYFTYYALPAPGHELGQWREIKAAASEALMAGGGTITHHHAVGRDHMPWYRGQRPHLFGAALEGAKRRLDPNGILNPGVLLDPLARSRAGDGRSV
jgi:alkyldihydroxyacetonephosphate synthase